MSRGLYEVSVADRGNGEERWVRVEAANPDAAQQKLADLGELAGRARLVELRDNISVPSSDGACPKCGGVEWSGTRGILLFILMIVMFPIGLLFLFVPPTWTCHGCGHWYRSHTPPVVNPPPSIWYRVAQGAMIAVIVGGVFLIFTLPAWF